MLPLTQAMKQCWRLAAWYRDRAGESKHQQGCRELIMDLSSCPELIDTNWIAGIDHGGL